MQASFCGGLPPSFPSMLMLQQRCCTPARRSRDAMAKRWDTEGLKATQHAKLAQMTTKGFDLVCAGKPDMSYRSMTGVMDSVLLFLGFFFFLKYQGQPQKHQGSLSLYEPLKKKKKTWKLNRKNTQKNFAARKTPRKQKHHGKEGKGITRKFSELKATNLTSLRVK